jgi:hypothetical protein
MICSRKRAVSSIWWGFKYIYKEIW